MLSTDETRAVLRLVIAADAALLYGDFAHARSIQIELETTRVLGAAIGALIVKDAIERAERNAERIAA